MAINEKMVQDIVQEVMAQAIDLDAVRMKGYGFQIEMKYTAFRLGFKLAEVPIIFINRRLGTSKMSGGIFSEAFWGVIGLRFRHILPVRRIGQQGCRLWLEQRDEDQG